MTRSVHLKRANLRTLWSWTPTFLRAPSIPSRKPRYCRHILKASWFTGGNEQPKLRPRFHELEKAAGVAVERFHIPAAAERRTHLIRHRAIEAAFLESREEFAVINETLTYWNSLDVITLASVIH